MFTIQFWSYLLILLMSVSIIFPIIIEAIKKVIGEEELVKKFGKIEYFCVLVSGVLGLISYLVFLLFYPLVRVMNIWDVIRLIVIGIGFTGCSIVGSQVGYDKLIKAIIEIWNKFHPVKTA